MENLQRISNALGGIEKKMEEAEQKLETLQKQLETAQEEAEKPFPKEKELQEKMERHCRTETPILNMDEKGNAARSGERSRSRWQICREGQSIMQAECQKVEKEK